MSGVRMSGVRLEVADASLRAMVLDAIAEAGLQPGSGPLTVADRQGMAAAVGAPEPGDRASPDAARIAVARAGADATALAGVAGVGELVILPHGHAFLVRLLRAATAPKTPEADVVVVTGARGGAGATTLCVGLAVAASAAAAGRAVGVDGDPAGQAIDLCIGLEDDEGVRWSELTEVRGLLPATALRGRLPHSAGVDWLATPAGTPNAASWTAVLASAAAAYPTVVVDLPRYRLIATPPPSGSRAIVVTTLDIAGVSHTRTLLDSGLLPGRPVVALRPNGGPLAMAAAAALLDGVVTVEVPHARAVAGAPDFGDLAAVAHRGSFGRACRRLLDEGRR